MNTQELLTTGQAAQRLGVSISYLNKLRLYGGGPVFVKIGAKVVYDPADLAEWIDARKHRSTSEYDRPAQ
jgi:hypothetical protein